MPAVTVQSEYTFDYIIIGAGLAGLCLADSLTDRSACVAVIDNKGIGAGASGIPIGMADPAASRNANLYWETENCYDALVRNLNKLRGYGTKTYFKKTGVLRPGITHKRALALERSYNRQDWPDGWCEWKTEAEIKAMSPEVKCVYGGLWHPNSMAVAIPEYLETYHSYLKESGILFYVVDNYRLVKQKNRWLIQNSDHSFSADKIIFTTGADTYTIDYWSDLPIHPVKGQVAMFEVEQPLPFSFSLSGNGYIGRIENNRFIVGSTYEHDFKHAEPDEYGQKYLKRKLKQSLPGIAENAVMTGQWAEVRASTPNRLPILGAHRSENNLYLFTGLGSKGLLYSPYCAQIMASYLTDATEIDQEISIRRFYDGTSRHSRDFLTQT